MSDEEFASYVCELIKLVSGLESGNVVCQGSAGRPCGRQYRVGIAGELGRLLERLRGEAMRRAKRADCIPETSRFALLEVD
jgi:hypothetical protein